MVEFVVLASSVLIIKFIFCVIPLLRGFGDLALIRPNDERVLGRKKCIDGASGAKDVLNNAQIYNSVEEMVHGEKDLTIFGTGMPKDMSLTRSGLKSTVAPRQYFEKIVEEYKAKSYNGSNYECDETREGINIAFLFGNERYGMNAEDMAKCEVILGIPTNPDFGSLNVASAVQLIAYDWREAIGGFKYENEVNNEQ